MTNLLSRLVRATPFFLFIGMCPVFTFCQTTEQKTMPDSSFSVQKTEAEWKQVLNSEAYRVLRMKGTERPFTGEYNMHFENGIYHCAACENPLFKSDHKFESGCGWPSFDQPISDEAVVEVPDNSLGMRRIEILCGACGGHLGHVFEDGPKKTTGLRYCINSVSLDFEEKKDSE